MSTATEGSLLRACEMPRTVTNESALVLGLHEAHVRRERNEILRSIDTGGLDIGRGKGIDRARYVERRFVATPGRDRDRFRHAADRQLHVDRDDARTADDEVLPLHRGEPGQRERDRVATGRERLDAIAPAAVGDRGTDLFDERRARGFNGHARQHCAGRVLDLTRENGLRRCDARDGRD